MKCAALAVCFAILSGGCASLTSDREGDGLVCTDRARNLESTELNGRKPYAVFAAYGARSHTCTIKSFYDVTPRGEANPVIQVRAWAARDGSGRSDLNYTDSRACPSAITAARWLEAYHPVDVLLPALNPSDVLTLTADGARYALWSNEARQDPGAQAADLYVNGWNEPSLSEIYEKVDEALATCLVPSQPSPP